MTTILRRFEWVAQSYSDPAMPAWSATVADLAEDGSTVRERVLNIDQAQAEGFSLTAIGAAIDVAAQAQVTTLTAQLAALQVVS